MVAIGIQSGGKITNPSILHIKNSNHIHSSNTFLPISKKNPQKPLSVTINSSLFSPHLQESVNGDDSNSKDGFISEIIDSWVNESVSDIVKNLQQAPLLVQIYNDKGRLKFETQKAIFDNWDFMKREWENEDSKSPDGVIFVEELGGQESADFEGGVNVTKAWGLVVQGKGVECGPVCYLLKTSKVCAGMGLGFCTHFCLMRVMNFRESALEQFRDCWILQ